MLASVFNVTLRAIALRAGPQDYPFEPRLTMPLALAAGLVNLLMFVQVMPLPAAALMAATMVGGLAFITQTLLRLRKLDGRFHQTYLALLTTNLLLTLAMVPLFMQVAPVLKTIAENPALLEQPDQVQVPQGIAFLMNMLNLWNFVVTGSIYRHALNAPLFVGLLVAFVSAFTLLMFVATAGSLASALFGSA